MRPARASLSLRTVLLLYVSAITLFPIVGIVYFLFSTGGFRLEPWLPIWVAMVSVFAYFNGLIVANTLLKPLFTLRDELARLAGRKERLASLEIEIHQEQPLEVRTLRQAFGSLLEALREENQKRGAFMATLVHDLKTPIIAANHALSAIQHNDALSRDERIELVKAIQQENETLLALVQKMVDANRFEREDVELQLELGELRPIVEAVVQRLSAQAKEKNIVVSLQGTGSALVAKKELERAVQNLLDNAIRYARHQVNIRLESGKITVSDDGAGLPTSLEQLIKPFNSERVQMAGREYTSGTGGLGLFIVHRIAELHGGRLEDGTHTQSGDGSRAQSGDGSRAQSGDGSHTQSGDGSHTQSGATLSICLQDPPDVVD
jgi:signal transduction histidine kinase